MLLSKEPTAPFDSSLLRSFEFHLHEGVHRPGKFPQNFVESGSSGGFLVIRIMSIDEGWRVRGEREAARRSDPSSRCEDGSLEERRGLGYQGKKKRLEYMLHVLIPPHLLLSLLFSFFPLFSNPRQSTAERQHHSEHREQEGKDVN